MSEKEKTLLEYFKGDELAANVWESKYAAEGEVSPDQMHRRMAKEFARADKKYQESERQMALDGNVADLSKYGLDREDLTEESIYNLFKDFKYIVPQGSIMSTLGTDTIASLSNCFVEESPLDSYAGILRTDSSLAFRFKRRGGAGTDISNLRPAGTSTKNTAKSSTGAVSFMHRFSNTTREVAMAGRRGALMLSMDGNHPDILDFIKVKRDGTSVTGANISVRLNREFMEAVENDEDYILRFPCDTKKEVEISELPYNELYDSGDGTYFKRIKAKEYWNEMVYSAKNHAEPGLMYWDNVIDRDPTSVYEQFIPTSSNPCGEQFLNPNDSCRLMALNLFSFVDNPFTPEAKVNFKKLYEVSYEHFRLGDNLVDLELEYMQRIIDKIESDPEPDDIKLPEKMLWEKSIVAARTGRRIGLGITALGDMLAALGVAYDSEEGLAIAGAVMKEKERGELDAGIDLAITRGPFKGWDRKKEYDEDGVHKNRYYGDLAEKFPELVKKMNKYGRRSISWSTIAPTGSVSILTQTTSGCEPIFQPFYMRRKKINPSEEGVRVDFVDETGDSWQEFPVIHEKFKDFIMLKEGEDFDTSTLDQIELQKYFEHSPWYGSTANDIDWQKRNEMQSVLQLYTTNAISSTINLPSTVTEQEVSDIYMNGWKLGLKGQTVYVNGSRSGVLVSNDAKKEIHEFDSLDAVERPKIVDADVYTTVSLGKKYNVFVGLVNEKPYEVFITDHFTNKDRLQIRKNRGSKYDLLKEGELYKENFTMIMSESEEAITRLSSLSMRHRVDIKHLVSQLKKTPSDNMFSFSRSLSRVLSKYVEDGQSAGVKCNDCGSENVIFEEGCHKCLDCGSSACG